MVAQLLANTTTAWFVGRLVAIPDKRLSVFELRLGESLLVVILGNPVQCAEAPSRNDTERFRGSVPPMKRRNMGTNVAQKMFCTQSTTVQYLRQAPNSERGCAVSVSIGASQHAVGNLVCPRAYCRRYRILATVWFSPTKHEAET